MAIGPPDDRVQDTPLYIFPGHPLAAVELIRLAGADMEPPEKKSYQLVRYGLAGQRVVLAELSLLDLIGLGLVCANESRQRRIVR